jgi:hypothetical protein
VINADSTYKSFECAMCFFYEMAELYLEVKKIPEAEKILNRAYEKDSNDKRIVSDFVELYAQKKERKKMFFWLHKLQATDTTIRQRMETVAWLLTSNYLEKNEAEVMLSGFLSKDLKEDNLAFRTYLEGLYAEVYRIGNPAKDYESAADKASSDDLDFVFDARVRMLEWKMNHRLFSNIGELAETIELHYSHKLDQDEWKAVHLALAVDYIYNTLNDPNNVPAAEKKERIGKGIQILKSMVEKKEINCKELKLFRRYLSKEEEYLRLLQNCDQGNK